MRMKPIRDSIAGRLCHAHSLWVSVCSLIRIEFGSMYQRTGQLSPWESFLDGTWILHLHLALFDDRIDTRWQIERVQRFHRGTREIKDINESCVGAHFVLFTSVFVDEG